MVPSILYSICKRDRDPAPPGETNDRLEPSQPLFSRRPAPPRAVRTVAVDTPLLQHQGRAHPRLGAPARRSASLLELPSGGG